ncbi:hypothetical protein BOTBODRAFT_38156 [Botryobasidium botryosum FD-172 SS1]|uniref:Protein kinase domain-containing protein n=1 Tax=Botryobasidium botryosum (strain FD-172 SS1) TaxID=930990 RepID=A0A067LY49_BOTB1|nr:hypothetical protein BOTBODRAFT_38156 [Botryobasidium botryosum FD-172 SS1]
MSGTAIKTIDFSDLQRRYANIPGIAAAIAAVQSILGACNDIKYNKQKCVLLANRSARLLEAIRDNGQNIEQSRLGAAIDRTVDTLHGIQISLAQWKSMSRVESVRRLYEVSRNVEVDLQRLDECIALFTFSTQLALCEWAQEFQVAQRADSDMLQEVLDGQREMERRQVDMMEQLLQLQILFREQPLDTASRAQTQQRLLSAQRELGVNLPITLLDGECQKVGTRAVAGSGMYDIFEGLYLGEEKVALKNIRGVILSDDQKEKATRRFERQAEIWSKLKNKHVLPLYGMCKVDGAPYLVSPWLRNGNAPNYIRMNPTVDRVKLCLEIAYGLRYLHSLSEPIIHGGLQGSNVLIDKDGHAVLSDFGLSKVLESQFTQSNGPGSAYRWMPPEIQHGEFSMACDIYSWAMTSLQLLSGKLPFCKIKMPGLVLIRVISGDHPIRSEHEPPGIDDRIWALFLMCWKMDPQERPDIHQVIKVMEEVWHGSV